MLEHFHEGNMTGRVEGIAKKVPHVYVEVSPELAQEREITTGSIVRLTSPFGQTTVSIVVTDRVIGKELYFSMNSRDEVAAVNYLTGSHHDHITHTPAYKETSVYMDVVKQHGEAPIVKGNFRLGNPNPQKGVLVEEKWKRTDYRAIVDNVGVRD
jgi:formate dehydrogenase major subunit